MEKRLIGGLAAALVVSLLVSAFLIGRLTGTRSVTTAPASASATVQPETSHDLPLVSVEHPFANAQIEERPANPVTGVRQETAPSRDQPVVSHSVADTAVKSYFAKIDAIHVAGGGDPMTFAQGILSGIESGDTSGVDALVDSAKTALAQANSIQPPPSCADYHRRLLGVLSEAAAGMVQMREAIVKSDLNAISALAPQMQATQQKVGDLDRLKKQLLGQ